MKIKCSVCNKEFIELFRVDDIVHYHHDCKIYESIYKQKRIIRIRVVN